MFIKTETYMIVSGKPINFMRIFHQKKNMLGVGNIIT